MVARVPDEHFKFHSIVKRERVLSEGKTRLTIL